MITVIGLGNERGDITKRGEQALLEAKARGAKIFVRTAKTRSYETLADLGVEAVALDYVYEKSRSFTTLAKNLCRAVRAGGEDDVYLVDGSACEDYSVKALIKAERGNVQIIDGVSKVSALATRANFHGCSYTALSAYELIDGVTPTLPLILYDLDDSALASDCKLILGGLFGEETQVSYIVDGEAKKIPLYALDRQKKYNYSSAVAIEKQELLKKTCFDVADLHEVLLRLRAPDGCPWDRVQTSDSIKMSAVEEAYELVDAIDQNDDEKILEETGDLLMQAMFHAVLKEETGAFDWTDVTTGVCHKLITRHTHVFGEDKAKDDKGALSVWEKNKMVEKNQVTFADSVNDVPKCFPALMRAQKVGKRASKAGMDFATVEDAEARLQEELQEFFTAKKAGDSVAMEKELGDILFACVNIGRKAGCDCEKALKESVERFAKRFTLAEKLALDEGKTVTALTEAEWDSYYVRAKKELAK